MNSIYKQLPQLEKIGTETQYKKYLKTVFPDSKVKQIVYHHSDEKLTRFKANFKEGYAARHGCSPKAIFFVGEPVKEEFLTKRPHIISALVNLENPFRYRSKFKTGTKEAKAHPGIREGIDYALEKKNDGVIFKKIWDNRTWCDVYVVLSPRQIHIIGSNKDIKMFKEFVKKK